MYVLFLVVDVATKKLSRVFLIAVENNDRYLNIRPIFGDKLPTKEWRQK